MLEYGTGEHIVSDTIIDDHNSVLKCQLTPELYSVLCYDTHTNVDKNCGTMKIDDTVSRLISDDTVSRLTIAAPVSSENDPALGNTLNNSLVAESMYCLAPETVSPVTHIEIIKSGSRRVTGANRVVPFLTSALKAGKQAVADSSLGEVYKTFLSDLDNSDNNKKCMICFELLLSCADLEYHVRNVHALDATVEQCFVCRKKYIFHDQLQSHLNHIHSIHCPDLICKICFMEFGTTMEQKAHERKHDQSHVCHMCPKKFSTEYLYQKHMNQHILQAKPNECRICGRRFKNDITLDIHQKRHINIICTICKIYFNNDISFLLHIKEHKNEDVVKILKCVEQKDQEETHLEEVLTLYTKLTFRTKINTCRGHENGVQENSVLECVTTMVSAVSQISDNGIVSKKGTECKLCGMIVSTAKELLDHRKQFHLRNRTCPFCGKRNRSVSQTWRHMNSHLLKSKINFPKLNNSNNKHIASDLNCIKEGTEVTSYTKNKQHQKNTSLYSCNICSRKFLYPGSRDSHVLQHSKDKCDSWKCSMCEQVFSHPGLLLTHTSSVHEPTMKCHICGKTFLSQNALQLHIKTHFGETDKKMYKCNICSVECPSLTGLQVHHRCHTGERPYVCGQCNGRFKRRGALKKHIQVVHNTASLLYHSCSECPRTFNSSGNLIRHYVRIHCQVRRFICGLCGSRSSQNQDLRKHFKVSHKIEMPNINGSDRKALREVYVIPGIDDLSEAHPHAVKIRAIVAEEKEKFNRLSELLTNKCSKEEDRSLKSVMEFIQDFSKGKQEHTVSVLQTSTEKDCLIKGEVLRKDHCTEYLEKVLHGEQSNSKNIYSPNCNSNECNKLFLCEHCKKTFSGENEYMEHVAEGSKSYMCKQCGYNFCNQVLLDNHLVTDHDVLCSITVNDGIHKGNFLKHVQSVDSAQVMQHLANVPQDAQHDASCMEQNNAPLKQINQEGFAVLSNLVKEACTFTSSEGISMSVLSKPTLPMCNNGGGVNSNNSPTMLNINGIILQNVIIQQNSNILPSITTGYQNQPVLNATALAPLVTFNSNISLNRRATPLYSVNDVQNVTILKDICSTDQLSVSESLSVLPLNAQQNLVNNSINGMSAIKTSEKCEEILTSDENLKQADFPDKSHSCDGDCKSGIFDESNKTRCKYCGERFYNTASLNCHLKCHAVIKSAETKPFGCPDCGKHFSEKHNLKVHLMTHTGERPYKCEDCGKQLRYRKDVMDHKRMHVGEKPFVCNDCSRKFIRRRDLVRHKLIHTGEKKHECPICGKTFGRLDQLRHAHLLTHTNSSSQPKHTCSICNKSFRLKSKLKQHEFLHSGLKKYKCELCKKCFALEAYLKTHMQCHKKRDMYLQCPKCPRRFISEATLQVHEKTSHARLKNTKKRGKMTEERCANGEETVLHSGNIEINQDIGADIEIQDVDFSVLEASNCNTVIYLQMTPDDLKLTLS